MWGRKDHQTVPSPLCLGRLARPNYPPHAMFSFPPLRPLANVRSTLTTESNKSQCASVRFKGNCTKASGNPGTGIRSNPLGVICSLPDCAKVPLGIALSGFLVPLRGVLGFAFVMCGDIGTPHSLSALT